MLPDLSTEAEVIAFYEALQDYHGWEIKRISWNSTPDVTICKDGICLEAEFEFYSKNFKHHGHDPDCCDLIICWYENWEECPLPVWCFRETADLILGNGNSSIGLVKLLDDWKQRYYEQRRSVSALRSTIIDLEIELERTQKRILDIKQVERKIKREYRPAPTGYRPKWDALLAKWQEDFLTLRRLESQHSAAQYLYHWSFGSEGWVSLNFPWSRWDHSEGGKLDHASFPFSVGIMLFYDASERENMLDFLDGVMMTNEAQEIRAALAVRYEATRFLEMSPERKTETSLWHLENQKAYELDQSVECEVY